MHPSTETSPTSPNAPSSGVLDSTYAERRARRPALIFRFRCRAAAAAHAIRQHLPNGLSLRLLELGAAEGRTLLELRSLVGPGEFVGIEKTRSLIARCPPLPSDTRLLEGDVATLDEELRAADFDVVVALALLEHLSDPVTTLQQAKQALRPGGLLIATCPVPFWDHLATRVGLLEPEQHESHPGKRELRDLMAQAGLQLVRYERFMWAPIAFLPYLHVPLPVGLALAVDRAVSRLRAFDGLFVNQLVVARRPSDDPEAAPQTKRAV